MYGWEDASPVHAFPGLDPVGRAERDEDAREGDDVAGHSSLEDETFSFATSPVAPAPHGSQVPVKTREITRNYVGKNAQKSLEKVVIVRVSKY